MGFDDGRLILDSDNGVYFAGQTVFGRIAFDQGKDKNIHGIYVSIKGFCKVHWTSERSRQVHDRREMYTVTHESYEEYLHRKIYVFGNESGEYHLNPGHHEFTFDFHIPGNCPSTFEGSYGHIRYRIKAVMNTSGFLSSNKEKLAAITVLAPTDLNVIPYCKEPIEYEILQSYCCWCMNAGSSEIQVKLPVAGYCPGQIIPVEVSCRNNSSVDIEEINFSIRKEITFHAASEPDTRTNDELITKITKGPVAGNTTKNWTVEITVPHMDVFNVDGCKFIDISYQFKVSTEVSGCHEGEEETRQIIFGTVPLVGYTIPGAPIAQVAPQINYPVGPIVNQPLSNSNYPNSNSPYPNANTPYPYPNNQHAPNITVNPPYANSPNSNTPYGSNPNIAYGPNTNTPYGPNSNTPYAPNNLPYPGANPSPRVSPHQSPYLPRSQNIPPYINNTPPQFPPAAPNVAPYPIENTTHVNSPNPTPYPNNPSPVPNHGMRTGKMGFIVDGEESAKAPLLPPGANVPYPQTPSNPYANASAPEPSTPDSLDKPSEPLAKPQS